MTETTAARTEATLAQCAEQNGDLFAFADLLPETALATAHYLDEMQANGVNLGPLHGCQIGVKDIIDVAGVSTRAGSLTRADQAPAERDAFVVARLRGAGAVLAAKTNTVEFALGGWGTNANIGSPHNPWNRDVPHTCGGSSSGSGAAVGAGLLPAALGSDTGGSVRIPASLCGCVGLKTSIGLVSRAGVVPLSDTLDTVGPLTQNVRLAAEILNVIQGEDRADPTTIDIPRQDPIAGLERGVSGLSLAALPLDMLSGVKPEVASAFAKAKDIVAGLGARIQEAPLPLSLEEYQARTTKLSAGDSYSFHHLMADDAACPINDTTRKRMLVARDLTTKDRVTLLRERAAAIRDFHAHFDRHDAIILPSTPTTAIPLSEVDEDNYTISLYTRFANYLELAGVSVPIDLSPAGLPTSLQIVVRRFDDPLALRIAHAFETARGKLS